jgi:MoxR-vWA-beta-propeller ternary system domain bpX2
MTFLLDDVCCACLPATAVPLLGDLRTLTSLRARLVGERLWLRWEAGDEEVLRRLIPIHGIELFAWRNGLWYRPGQHLPVFDVPADEDGQSLAHFLAPAPVQPEQEEATFAPLELRIVRDNRPRPAAALCCTLVDLRQWADQATSRQLACLQAALHGSRVLLMGQPLPPLPEAERFWGKTILTPLGWRPEPALTEIALGEALGLAAGEIALLGHDGVEVLPRAALTPLTRAGARLAGREKA